MYKVIWKDKAEEDLSKIDRVMAKKLKDKVKNYLVKNPQQLGEPLAGQYKGYYRYRVSDYRVIYEIQETNLLVLVIKVGHRREVY